MILPVGLKVLSQMLDPASEKCDLHVRAAGIFLVQLERLKIHRLVTLCHNEGANLDEHRVLATIHRKPRAAGARVIRRPHFFRVFHRTRDPVSTENALRGGRPGS